MSSKDRQDDEPLSLETVGKYVAASPVADPARFVLELAHRWKERGGTVSGKPRHSDRYLDDLLRLQGTPIKSLTPKLKGQTNLKPADAGTLVNLFVSFWEYVGDPYSGEIGKRPSDLYKPLLPKDEVEGLSRYVMERMAEVGVVPRGDAEVATALSLPGQDTIDLIATEFEKSDALFTVGAGQTMLVPQPEMTLVGFRNLINRLWAIDTAGDRERMLVWPLDLGRQDFEDPESRLRFMNVEALIARFKALKRFREAETEARWNWLRSRAVVVLHDTRSVRPEVPRLPAFDPHHVLFSAIPPRWAGSPEFRTLYGSERVQETIYSIFLSRMADDFLQDEPLDQMPSQHPHQNYELRYFGHALLESNGKGDRQLRGLRLGAPGRSYVEALGTVFIAAAQTLGLRSAPAELVVSGMKIDPAHAIEKLRHHGFLLLRLEEFIAL